MASGKRRYKVNLEDLISVVRQYSFLYDPKNPDFRNGVKRDNLWQEIAKQFRVPANVIQKKWKSVKDRYIRERRLYHIKVKTYENKAYIAPPRWRLYNLLEEVLGSKLSMRYRRTSNAEINLLNTPTNKQIFLKEGKDLSENPRIHALLMPSVNDENTNRALNEPDCQPTAKILPSSPSPPNVSDFTVNLLPSTSKSEQTVSNTVMVNSYSMVSLTPSQIKNDYDDEENENRDEDEESYHLHSEQSVDFEEKENAEDIIMNSLQYISSTLSVLSSKILNPISHPEDDVHYYVMSLAQRLRNLNGKNRHAFKMKSEQLLYDLEQMQK